MRSRPEHFIIFPSKPKWRHFRVQFQCLGDWKQTQRIVFFVCLFYYHRSTTGTTMQMNNKLNTIMKTKVKRNANPEKINPIITSQHFSTFKTKYYNIVRYTWQKEAEALWIIHFPFALYQFTHRRMLNWRAYNTYKAFIVSLHL